MLIVGKKNEKSANSCVNDFWLANGINSLQPITCELLDTDVVAGREKKQQTDEIPIFFAGLSFAVDKLDNIITLAIAQNKMENEKIMKQYGWQG